jgi:penicillin-binding protein 2
MLEKQYRLTDYDPGKFKRKFNVLLWLVLFAFFLLISRLWYLQVIRGDNLRQRSENNRIRVQEVKPLRGLVFDTHGTILVDNQPSFDVSLIPEDTKDIQAVINRFADLCDQDGMTFVKSLSTIKFRKPFVPIKIDRDIGRDKLAIVETNSLDLPGLMVDVVPVRKYVYGEAMAHVLGYVGEISVGELGNEFYKDYKSDDILGKYGIERYLDRYLKGVSGGEQVEVNVRGRKLSVLGRVEPVPGLNVTLTLDAHLQKICWDAFDEKAGTVIVMDPRDGSLLSLISKPSFDPNLFNRGIPGEIWESLSKDVLSPLQNRSISGQYPPGSLYKLIVAAAALEEGVITKDTKIGCNGTFDMGNRTFRCWRKTGHGVVDLHRAIVESCDVYFYHLGEMLGVEKLAEYSKKFGLGSKTFIELHGEKSGLVPTKRWKLERVKEPWQGGETISLAIGQGFVLATPLQLIRAYSAIANGGILYKPRLIERITTAEGDIIQEFFPEKESIIPLHTRNMKILRYALWGAVNEEHGTGWVLKREERDVSGKTGTAQVVAMPKDEEEKDKEIPYKLRDHALFVCYAPRDNPEIAVLVVVEHGGHGGATAAPIARRIIDGYFELKKSRAGLERRSMEKINPNNGEPVNGVSYQEGA